MHDVEFREITSEEYIHDLIKLGSKISTNDPEGICKNESTIKEKLIDSDRYRKEGLLGIFIKNQLVGFGSAWIREGVKVKSYITTIIEDEYLDKEVFDKIVNELLQYSLSQGAKEQYTRLREHQKKMIGLYKLSGYESKDYSLNMEMNIKSFTNLDNTADLLDFVTFSHASEMSQDHLQDSCDLMTEGFRNKPGDKEYTIEEMSEDINECYKTILVYKNNTPIGIGSIIDKANDDMGYVCNIVVKSENRGEGHGKSIVRKLLEMIDDMKRSKAGLSVSESNISAVSLYRSIGFNKDERVITFSRNIE